MKIILIVFLLLCMCTSIFWGLLTYKKYKDHMSIWDIIFGFLLALLATGVGDLSLVKKPGVRCSTALYCTLFFATMTTVAYLYIQN